MGLTVLMLRPLPLRSEGLYTPTGTPGHYMQLLFGYGIVLIYIMSLSFVLTYIKQFYHEGELI